MEYFNSITIIVIAGSATIVAGFILKILGTLFDYLFDYLKGLTTNMYLSRALIVAEEVVRATNQTFAEEYKKAAKDGKFTKEEVLSALNACKTTAIEKLKGSFIGAPKEARDMIEAQAEDMIEAAVDKLKAEKFINPYLGFQASLESTEASE